MDREQITDVIEAELDRFAGERQAESLRWAVWLVWEVDGGAMTSRQFADAAETLGVNRGTATNRYSEARRNWKLMNGE